MGQELERRLRGASPASKRPWTFEPADHLPAALLRPTEDPPQDLRIELVLPGQAPPAEGTVREDESVVVHLPVQEYPERRVVNDYPYAGKRRRLDYDLDAAEAALAAKPTLELVPELVLPPEAAPRPALVIAWKHVLHVGLTIATRGKWLPVYLLVVLRDRRRRQAATRVG